MGRHSGFRPLLWAVYGLLAANSWGADLDQLKARGVVRLLVVYSKTFYFLDGAQPRGISYEFGTALERQLNAGITDPARHVNVQFVPVSRDQLIPALIAGRGDIAAVNLTITPERLRQVDFSVPFADDVNEILVLSASSGVPESLADLSGRSVYVRRSSSYFASLEDLNQRLSSRRLAPVQIVLADENLEDEDILEMVNAGLVDATVVDSYLARFWSQIFPNLRAQSQIALRDRARIAWAIRRGSPQLKDALDYFAARNQVGTVAGDLVLQRYLKDTRWVRNAAAEADMQRFNALTKLFQKYAQQYRFEWLMLVALGYEESGLDQKARGPAGAIGVMQVKPSMISDISDDLPNIEEVEDNIHAGVKYLRYIVDAYFNEPGIDQMNRELFAFAAYRSGSAEIVKLRRDAAAAGLDPNKWFYNVELVAARTLGRESVKYVSNIFKYYVAYKLALERARERDTLKRKAG